MVLETIVLAKSATDVVADNSRWERFDGVNYRRPIALRETAVACVWLLKGTAADLVKARAYAAAEGWHVYTYPSTEQDPLGRAKRDHLSAAYANA